APPAATMRPMAESRAPGAATFGVPAAAYDRHAGRYSTALAPELAAAGGLTAGATALDVGCGPGALTAVLVELLAPGRVEAVDPAPTFAEAAAQRVPGARVQLGRAETLLFTDDQFDAALAQLVITFLSDPAA